MVRCHKLFFITADFLEKKVWREQELNSGPLGPQPTLPPPRPKLEGAGLVMLVIMMGLSSQDPSNSAACRE